MTQKRGVQRASAGPMPAGAQPCKRTRESTRGIVAHQLPFISSVTSLVASFSMESMAALRANLSQYSATRKKKGRPCERPEMLSMQGVPG